MSKVILGSLGIGRDDGQDCTDVDEEALVNAIIDYCEVHGLFVGSSWSIEDEDYDDEESDGRQVTILLVRNEQLKLKIKRQAEQIERLERSRESMRIEARQRNA